MRPKIPQKYLDETDKIYDRRSAYSNMYALKLALEKDTKFKKEYDDYRKTANKNGLRQWLKQEWVQVEPFIMKNEKVPCGAPSVGTPACRPLKKVGKTPPTMADVINKVPKKVILTEVNKKKKNPDYRIEWKKLTTK